MRRPRGCGGRFLNTKSSNDKKIINNNEATGIRWKTLACKIRYSFIVEVRGAKLRTNGFWRSLIVIVLRSNNQMVAPVTHQRIQMEADRTLQDLGWQACIIRRESWVAYRSMQISCLIHPLCSRHDSLKVGWSSGKLLPLWKGLVGRQGKARQ